tara:strand:+ start:220 stop:498 length:279 start_codon:yes stop_codon:yes gene_type:complete
MENKMKLLTEKKIVTVSDITYSNSAFAVTQKGEGVFINARMVEKLGIEEGDDLVVKVLLNYVDKRDQVKYRAIKGSVIQEADWTEIFEEDED